MEENNATEQNFDMRLIVEYFEKIRQLLRYTKGKDEIIETQGKILQQYRDGFAVQAFKSFALALIDFREACKKDLLSLEKHDYDVAKIEKYLNFLSEDFTDLLLQNGLSENNGELTYNGHDILKPIAYRERNEEQNKMEDSTSDAQEIADEVLEEVAAAQEEPCEDENTTIDLSSRLEQYHREIIAALSDTQRLVSSYKSLLEASKQDDDDNKWTYIYPVLYGLGKLRENIIIQSSNVPGGIEEAKANYKSLLNEIIDTLEKLLGLMGITVVATDDAFNSAQHKIMRVIPTDNAENDRVVCAKITDAYALEGKIISHQKVDVYKFKK